MLLNVPSAISEYAERSFPINACSLSDRRQSPLCLRALLCAALRLCLSYSSRCSTLSGFLCPSPCHTLPYPLPSPPVGPARRSDPTELEGQSIGRPDLRSPPPVARRSPPPVADDAARLSWAAASAECRRRHHDCGRRPEGRVHRWAWLSAPSTIQGCWFSADPAAAAGLWRIQECGFVSH